MQGTNFSRFRALVQLNKPLKRVMRLVTPDGSTHLGLMMYERLPTFFFLCRLVGHRYQNCAKVEGSEQDVKIMQYGPWMEGVDCVASNQVF